MREAGEFLGASKSTMCKPGSKVIERESVSHAGMNLNGNPLKGDS